MSTPTQPPPGWRPQPPQQQRQQPESRTLAMVSLICGVGSVAFLAAPRMFVAFAVVLTLAGLVTGIEGERRQQGWMATAGIVVSILMGLFYVMAALT